VHAWRVEGDETSAGVCVHVRDDNEKHAAKAK
jgi:hypothetical protein